MSTNWKSKYLKYKQKYGQLVQDGGNLKQLKRPITIFYDSVKKVDHKTLSYFDNILSAVR